MVFRRFFVEVAVVLVTPPRRGLAMIAGDEPDHVDFFGLESPQIAVLDQVVRVLVVPLVADVDADVVQDRRVLEPLALAVGEPVHDARLVEQLRRELRHLQRVFGPVVAPLAEFDDAAPADVGIAIGLRDLLAVPRDVIEDEPFAQRHVAQRDVARAEPADDRVEQDGAGHGEVGAPRLEPGTFSRSCRSRATSCFRARRICLAVMRRFRSVAFEDRSATATAPML